MHEPAPALAHARRRRRGVIAVPRERLQRLLAEGVLVAIAAGGLLHLAGADTGGDAVWAACAGTMLVPLGWSALRSLLRADVGVDLIALLAMAGALALGEYLAGAVIALMLSGGNALEAAAAGRARRDLTRLVESAPRIAHLRRDSAIVEVPVDEVAPGDLVVVRSGEVVPVDGEVAGEAAVLDESTLTGEPLPVERGRGELVRSGSTNAADPFELRALRPASESAYAALVRIVREAERRRAPFVRLADRYALVFLPLTLAIAGGAWALSGEAVRAVAVLVIATPCPLILAAPVAIVSGLSRAARAGVIVKGGAAIEKLGEARSVLLDKTGTLTIGEPAVERITSFGELSSEELLRLTASLEQLSAHVLAEAVVHDAERRGLGLEPPTAVVESPGRGVEGEVAGCRVSAGAPSWLAERGVDLRGMAVTGSGLDGRARILVAVDGRLEGEIAMSDRLRPDARALVESLRSAGVRRVALVSGDRERVARAVAAAVGIDEVYADQTPESKLALVRELERQPDAAPVVMVGDGVNDAPALALADVGIAMGSAGATVSSETADAVITIERISRVADAVRIGRRSLRIARQSVVAGIGLSVIGMGFAAAGYLSPVAGALLQEGIDVAVILNALRALRA
ncbi:MAG: cadmium-translocating P-type ATPase [Thermoleophilaceae bacterium]|nr:cadmium-translocating P-type ATPase [Thermoleophilaceae bacterium]